MTYSTADNTANATDLFIGRVRELERVGEALGALARGEAAVLCLVGEPGVGKSRLSAECARAAEAQGARIASGRCWEGGGAPPLHPWRQVLSTLGVALDSTTDFGGEEAARFAVLEQVRAALQEAARAEPLVVVLEDLHAADPASVVVLRYLAGSLTGAVLIVATWRELELRADADRREGLAEVARAARVLALEGFTDDELAAYLAAHDARADAHAVREVAEVTGGNPLFVQTLLRRPGDVTALTRGGGVEAAIRRWLDPLDAPVRDLLATAAILGREFDLEVLGAMTGRPVLEPLAPAIDMGTLALTGPVHAAFHHALIREILYADLPAARRARLHVAAAEALAAVHGADAPELLGAQAKHLLAGAAYGGVGPAVDACLAAGAQAARVGAAETARAHYAQALELRPADTDRLIAARAGLGRAAWAMGDRAAGRQAYLDLADVARRHERPDALATAALGIGGDFGFVEYGVDEEQNALLREAIAAQPAAAGGLRSRLLARLAVGVLYAGDPQPPVALAEEAVALAREAGDQAALAHALGARRQATTSAPGAEGNLALSEATIAAAERAGIPELALRGISMRCFDLLELGRVEDARAAIDRYEALAERLRHPYFLASPAQRRAGIAYLQGDFDIGDRWLEEAVRRGDGRVEIPDFEVSNHTLVYLRAMLRGELSVLEHSLRQFLEAGGHLEPTWRCALVLMLADSERLDEARTELARLAPPDFPALRRDPFRTPGLLLLASAVPRLGVPDAAEALLDELEPYGEQAANVLHTTASFGAVSRLLGDLEACLGRRDAALARYEHALAFNRRMGAVPWVERCEAALAGLGAARPTAAVPPATAVERPAFRREADYWVLGGADAPLRLRDLKGLRYIRHLLEHPGVEIHALELAGGPRDRGPGAVEGAPRSAGDGAGARLDSAARTAYRERIMALREVVEEADRFNDPERAARAREELEFVGRELASAVGLGGRDRPQASDAERARVAVRRAIDAAIKRIASHDAALGRRLEAEIRTGTFCVYVPLDDAPAWSFD